MKGTRRKLIWGSRDNDLDRDCIDYTEFELKTGYWQIQLNELHCDEKIEGYEVECYWRNFIGEHKDREKYATIFTDESDAKEVYDRLNKISDVKRELDVYEEPTI